MKLKEKLKEKAAEKVGKDTVQDNPFVTSEEFVQLVTGIAMLPKVLLKNSRGPNEFMNALLSLTITMLRNVPDLIWDGLRERVHEADKPTDPHAIMFNHLDAMRSYHGKEYISVFETELDDMPSINTKPPKHTV